MTSTERTRVTKPLMDYASLSGSVESESIGSRTGDPFARLAGTPFEADIRASKADGKARSYTLANADVAKQVAYLLRLAARKADLGVRIPEPYETVAGGKVKVYFQGKTKRQEGDTPRQTPQPRQRKGEAKAAFDKRVAEWQTKTGRTFVPRKPKAAK